MLTVSGLYVFAFPVGPGVGLSRETRPEGRETRGPETRDQKPVQTINWRSW